MNYLQLSHQTKVNRFPKIFDRAKRLKPDARRILSFGCSSGEECQTIADYFPDSEIVGVDLNHYCVVRARLDNKHKDRVFFHDNIGATGKYDIVFCLMVLFCMERPIEFDDFETVLKEINKHLNPGGLLVVYTAEYNPRQATVVLENYKVIRQWMHVHSKNQKQYFDGYYKKLDER